MKPFMRKLLIGALTAFSCVNTAFAATGEEKISWIRECMNSYGAYYQVYGHPYRNRQEMIRAVKDVCVGASEAGTKQAIEKRKVFSIEAHACLWVADHVKENGLELSAVRCQGM